MSSLRRGHANLLCIVPILVYVLLKRALMWSLNAHIILSLSDNLIYTFFFRILSNLILSVSPFDDIFLEVFILCMISVHGKSLQSCSTLYDPMGCSLPGSSAHWIFQERVLEWVAVPSSRGSSDPGTEPASLMSPVLSGRFFTTTATQEALIQLQIPTIPVVFSRNSSHSSLSTACWSHV